MRIPLRPIVGFSAGATSMALVLLAGLTSPPAEPIQQARAKCTDSAQDSPLAAPVNEAQSPA